MTRQQETALAEHIGRIEKASGPIVCPACRSTAWGFRGITPASPHAAPMAQAVCKNCGNVLLFDCQAAGIGV